MENKSIINLISFARGENQAHPLDYMVEAIREQVELFKKHGFPSTVLLMYDAFIEPEFYNYLKPQVEKGYTEVGLWFEIPAQLVEKAGLTWRGREGFTWDWYNDVGFLIGYTLVERKLLIDTAMESFKETFGYYPEVVGSWHLDAFSLNYLYERYSVKGACMCRDQWGIDGYSIWGGYEPIYYPSKTNMLCPASTEENRIKMPMLRMLGPDPLYQFDVPYMKDKWEYKEEIITQITLEPTILSDGVLHSYCGMDKNWSNWYFDMMTTGNTPFSYAQTGQENGFGWYRIGNGINLQCDLLDEYTKDGRITVEKMSDTCRWFSDTYKETPSVTVDVQKDWQNKGRKAMWYYSQKYRSSILFEDGYARIREIRLFDENYKELYLEQPCVTKDALYDNLPLMDGTLWSVRSKTVANTIDQKGIVLGNKDSRAGIYPVFKGSNGWELLKITNLETETDGDITTVKLSLENGEEIEIKYTPDHISVTLPDNAALKFVHNNNKDIKEVTENRIYYRHNGYEYSLSIEEAKICDSGDGIAIIKADNSKICFSLKG